MKDVENVSRLMKENKNNIEVISNLETKIQGLKQEISQLEKNAYDKSRELSTIRSDYALLQQDLDVRNQECANLKIALESLNKSHMIECRQITDRYTKKVNELENSIRVKQEESNHQLQEDYNKLNALKIELENKLSDEMLLRRKMEIEVNSEKRKMQKTLESALTQLQNSREDVVDRTLVANLIVSYFQRKR
jgi:chromosome segregation ATPase